MARNESSAWEVTLNDEEHGEEAEKLYDFRTAKPGEVVTLLTDQGMHELVRLATAAEGDDSMKNWLHDGQVADVTLFEPNKNGASLRLPGRAVLERNMEVRVNYVKLPSEQANVSRSLGRAAGIAKGLERAKALTYASMLDK